MPPQVGPTELLEYIFRELPMGEGRVRAVAGVLQALEPIARQDCERDLTLQIRPNHALPAWDQRPRLRSEIGPDQAAQLLDRVGPNADSLLERAPRLDERLVRLLDALAGRVIEPAVIGATQPAWVRDAEQQTGPAVSTMGLHKAEAIAAVAEEHEVLAQEANRQGARRGQLARGGDWVPIAPHQLTARCAGSHATPSLVLFGRWHTRSPPLRAYTPLVGASCALVRKAWRAKLKSHMRSGLKSRSSGVVVSCRRSAFTMPSAVGTGIIANPGTSFE